MSTFRNPVGPQSNRVYWRRRLLVGLGLLAVIVIVILIIVGPGSGGPVSKTPKQTTSVTPKATAQKEGAACAPANVKLEPVTDMTTYSAGANPLISLKITNTSPVACTLNVGSTVQELRITSGSELFWSSKDCQKSPVDAPTILQPNVPQSTTPISWDRTRSSKDTCDATTRKQVTAGGASYHLTVIVGDITSPTTAQFILN